VSQEKNNPTALTPEALAKLSKEEKLLLLSAIDEYNRRQKDKRDVYLPNAGQLPVHRSQALLRLVTSGNGSGKSCLAANEAHWRATGYNPVTKTFSPVPARIIYLLDSPNKADDVVLPELQKWHNIRPEQLTKRGRHHTTAIEYTNGSEIIFFSHSQDFLQFESLEADMVICDEPPPRQVYISLRRAGRKKGVKPSYLIIGTPLAAAWLRTEVYEPWSRGEFEDGEVECFRFGTKVNEHNLADGYMASFGAMLSEKEKRIRFDGEFFDLDGLALAHLWKDGIHDIEPFEVPTDWPCVVAVDPHPSKAHVATLLASDKDGYLYVVKELSAKMIARDFARTLKAWYKGHRVIDIVVDSLGSADTTSGEGFKSFIQVLNEEGIRARPTTWDEKQDEAFISRIQDALAMPEKANNFGQKIPKLRAFKNCTGFISDVRNVSWVKMKNIDEYKPKLDISNKDFLACVKYGLSTNLNYNKSNVPAYYPVKKANALYLRRRR
jgi:hypothetical protein